MSPLVNTADHSLTPVRQMHIQGGVETPLSKSSSSTCSCASRRETGRRGSGRGRALPCQVSVSGVGPEGSKHQRPTLMLVCCPRIVACRCGAWVQDTTSVPDPFTRPLSNRSMRVAKCDGTMIHQSEPRAILHVGACLCSLLVVGMLPRLRCSLVVSAGRVRRKLGSRGWRL